MKDRFLAALRRRWWHCAYLYCGLAIFLALSWAIRWGRAHFRRLVGILLLISAGLLALETRRGHQSAGGRMPRAPVHPTMPVLADMLIWTIGYYAAFEPAGYIIATIVYLFGLLCLVQRRAAQDNALIAVGFTAVAYGVFSQLLDVQLPPGPLSF